jgi:hypothetical protein
MASTILRIGSSSAFYPCASSRFAPDGAFCSLADTLDYRFAHPLADTFQDAYNASVYA